MDMLGKAKSILKGALNLGQEPRCETSEPPDQSAFIDRFNLFGYGLGRKCETGNTLGYDRVTGRKMRRVLGQRDDDHELACADKCHGNQVPLTCDGPEDCPGAQCCYGNGGQGGSTCKASCSTIACHRDTDCPQATSKCCPKAFTPAYGVCQTAC